MNTGTQDYVGDPRNDDVLVSVDGALVHRDRAVVSVFDSGFVLGDGVWEGLRLIDGKIAFLDAHLDRLYAGARMLMIEVGLDRAALVERLFDCLDANGMEDGVHARLMVTRGKKRSPYQDPRLTVGAATIVIVPEWKQPKPDVVRRGIHAFHRPRAPHRPGRPGPPKLNSHSKINDILACIQATAAGADEALMLDDRGFVATCNSTHFFVVRGGELWTSAGGFCLRGITRDAVIRAAKAAGVPAFERDFSLFDVYSADEAFVTGTFAGLTPVSAVDGRILPASGDAEDRSGPITRRLRDAYIKLRDAEARGRA